MRAAAPCGSIEGPQQREVAVSVVVRVQDMREADLPPVEYRWDADTDILQVTLRTGAVGEGLSGSVDIEGADGAWLMLEVMAGRLSSIEVAVWPDVRTRATLLPPEPAGNARIEVPAGRDGLAIEALEFETAIRAVADEAERTIHFRFGPPRPSRALRVARDLLVEVDAKSRLAGFWFLNVPPFPAAP
jgi:hypothetical protein